MALDFLSTEDVIQIHRDQIERYGGAPDIRDAGLLASAVEAPRATFGGSLLNQDVFEVAAAYLFHLVQNHPFVDGNKRTGAAAALVFLDLNSIECMIADDPLAELVISVARGETSKNEIAIFLRNHAG